MWAGHINPVKPPRWEDIYCGNEDVGSGPAPSCCPARSRLRLQENCISLAFSKDSFARCAMLGMRVLGRLAAKVSRCLSQTVKFDVICGGWMSTQRVVVEEVVLWLGGFSEVFESCSLKQCMAGASRWIGESTVDITNQPGKYASASPVRTRERVRIRAPSGPAH